MRESVRMILVLALIGLIAGASLALVYKYAMPKVEINQKKELDAAIFKVFSEGKTYKIVDREDGIYKVLDGRNNVLGYAFIAEGSGYQGEIKLMVGLRNDLATISGIEVLESVETPGLGGEITAEAFKKQFIGLNVLPEIVCSKTKPTKPNEIQAITAATISSKSVVNIINEKIKTVGSVIARSLATEGGGTTKQSQK